MRIHRLALVLLVAYLALLLFLTLRPVGSGAESNIRLNLHPWATIGPALRLGPGTTQFRILIGNVLAFMPLGLLLPAAFRRLPWPLVIVAGLLLSTAIEVTQYEVSVYLGHGYRRADIDDVIVNVAGTIVGLVLFGLAAGAVSLVKRWRRTDAAPRLTD